MPRRRSSFVRVATLLEPCGHTMPWAPHAVHELDLADQILPVDCLRLGEGRVQDHERPAHRLRANRIGRRGDRAQRPTAAADPRTPSHSRLVSRAEPIRHSVNC